MIVIPTIQLFRPFHFKMRVQTILMKIHTQNLSNSFDSSAVWPNLIILIVYAKAPGGISVNFAD